MASASSTLIEKSGEETPPQLVHDDSKLGANIPGNNMQEADPNASPRQIHGILVSTAHPTWLDFVADLDASGF